MRAYEIHNAYRSAKWHVAPAVDARFSNDISAVRPAAAAESWPAVNLPVFDTTDITNAATDEIVFASVREALIAHAHGQTLVPPPLHLAFSHATADCHVKVGWVAGSSDFTVKIAPAFYNNRDIGLPTNSGLMCVISAETGQVRGILDDGGLLTAWRTAAAGALATDLLARRDASTLAIFGTGEQARLQVEWLTRLRPIDTVLIHGRSQERMETLAEALSAKGIGARPATREEASSAEMIVTTTPATAPVFDATHIRPGAHVTGIGTDMPHKNELPAQLFARATLIATDDHEQCLDHGDFGCAVRAGTASPDGDTPLGHLLEFPPQHRPNDAITVADLTGVGAIDAVLASAILSKIVQ
jgi:ornithine cyclodeaminase/alanine dehydrogenase-like protein (mu-crystallin family)